MRSVSVCCVCIKKGEACPLITPVYCCQNQLVKGISRRQDEELQQMISAALQLGGLVMPDSTLNEPIFFFFPSDTTVCVFSIIALAVSMPPSCTRWSTICYCLRPPQKHLWTSPMINSEDFPPSLSSPPLPFVLRPACVNPISSYLSIYLFHSFL